MCELLGLSSDRPVQPQELLCRFAARGGGDADNPDGWGLAAHVDGAFTLTKEPLAAARSARFRELCAQTRSSLILGHVRKANPPTALTLANTHPFLRLCCGREWVFAHNGTVAEAGGAGVVNRVPSLCVPSGDTDSEHAFCIVLDQIAAAFAGRDTDGTGWFDVLAHIAETLASHGRFNFLMSDGAHLIAYGHDRLYALAGATVVPKSGSPQVVVIATEPLTSNPAWTVFLPGELRVYRGGQQVARFLTHPRAPTSALPANTQRLPTRGP